MPSLTTSDITSLGLRGLETLLPNERFRLVVESSLRGVFHIALAAASAALAVTLVALVGKVYDTKELDPVID